MPRRYLAEGTGYLLEAAAGEWAHYKHLQASQHATGSVYQAWGSSWLSCSRLGWLSDSADLEWVHPRVWGQLTWAIPWLDNWATQVSSTRLLSGV